MNEVTQYPDPTLLLGEDELRGYQANGYLVRKNAFTSAELTRLHSAVERACATALQQAPRGHEYFLDGKRFVDVGQCTLQFEPNTAAEPSQNLRVIEPIPFFDSVLNRLIDDPRLTSPIASILGTSVLSLWTAKLNLKGPGGSGFGWHQDSPYWIHNCEHVDMLPNVMLTLDEQSLTNGCFEIIRGSHRQGMLPGANDGTLLGGFFTAPDAFDIHKAVKLTVPAGSLIFFDPHCVHGSGPNRSTEQRRALIYTFQPGNHPTLKTGESRPVKPLAFID